MLRVVSDEGARAGLGSALDELVVEGARRMLAAALEAEVDAYIAGLVDERDEQGRRLVVRNGHAAPRTITTGAGRVEVRAPRVDDRRVDESTVSGIGSAARSCHRGRARARRSPRSCP